MKIVHMSQNSFIGVLIHVDDNNVLNHQCNASSFFIEGIHISHNDLFCRVDNSDATDHQLHV